MDGGGGPVLTGPAVLMLALGGPRLGLGLPPFTRGAGPLTGALWNCPGPFSTGAVPRLKLGGPGGRGLTPAPFRGLGGPATKFGGIGGPPGGPN